MVAVFPQRSIISPSLSSDESRSDEADAERRRQLSPSPEVDLSTPDFDDIEDNGTVAPPTPSGSFSGRLMHQEPISNSNLVRNHRAASPPLEKDEKEFTQTARGMQRRKFQNADAQQDKFVHLQPSAVDGSIKHMDLDGDLFGDHRNHGTNAHNFVTSPAMKPLAIPGALGKRAFEDITDIWIRDEMEWDSRSPENIDLEELDGMFDNFE